MLLSASSQIQCTSAVNATGLGRGSSTRVYKKIGPLAYATTTVSALIAVLCCELVSSHMCSCHCILWLSGGLEHRTADVVALCIANSDEYCDISNNKIVSAVCVLLRIIGAYATGIHLMSVASCDQHLVQIWTVDIWLLIHFSPWFVIHLPSL